MTQEQKIVKNKLGLLKLAHTLGSVSEVCKVLGFSRDSFAGVYTHPESRLRGIGKSLQAHALAAAPHLDIRTMFESAGFAPLGRLPRVAELDGVERDLAILVGRIP